MSGKLNEDPDMNREPNDESFIQHRKIELYHPSVHLYRTPIFLSIRIPHVTWKSENFARYQEQQEPPQLPKSISLVF